MPLHRLATCCLVLLCVYMAPPAMSQQLDQDDLSRFQLANKYMEAGDYEQAIVLLKELHEAHAGTYLFFDKLATAYENTKQYEKAVLLLEGRLEKTPTPALAARKAHLLYLNGRNQAAFDAWQEAVHLAPHEPATYQTVAQSLMQHRLFERAIATLKEGRAKLETPGAYRMSLAYLYALSGTHERAAREYLGLLREDPRRMGLIKSRIMNFGDDTTVLDAYVTGAKKAARAHAEHIPTRELLAWLQLQAGRHSEALETTRTTDRMDGAKGSKLLALAQHLRSAAAYAVAVATYEEIISQYPSSAFAALALVEKAAALEAWAREEGGQAVPARGGRDEAPRYREAAGLYQRFLQQHPNHARAAEALQKLGRLQKQVFHDFPQARATLEAVVAEHAGTEAAYRARLDLADVAIAQGQTDRARLVLSRLIDELEGGHLLQRARYELARLHFYRGDFQAAKALLKVLNTSTSDDVANDAIALRVLIHENSGPDSTDAALVAFAHARMLQEQHRLQEAVAAYDRLLQQHGRHPIADEARYHRAEALFDSGEPTAAFEALMEVPLMYPKSMWADRSLFRAAVIREEHLEDGPSAVSIYLRLLSEYPGSLLSSEARKRIQSLRGGGV